MGDADLRQLERVGAMDQVTGILDELDDNLLVLHNTINILQERTQEAVNIQEKSYENFKKFFIGLNIVIIPLVMVAGFHYGLIEYLPSQIPETVLRSLITLLLVISGGIGVPLYLGALLAVYKFRVPLVIMPEEMVRAIVAELGVDVPGESDTSGFSSEVFEDSLELMEVSPHHSSETFVAVARTNEPKVLGNENNDDELFSMEERDFYDLWLSNVEETDTLSEAKNVPQEKSENSLSESKDPRFELTEPSFQWKASFESNSSSVESKEPSNQSNDSSVDSKEPSTESEEPHTMMETKPNGWWMFETKPSTPTQL